MQPVIYLLVRVVLTWVQYLERDSRAFAHGTQLALVAGAAHCWAVVYALFVAVLARVARHNYVGHTTYDELLPWWVQMTERVAALAMVIWWIAGCLWLLVSMVEDDAKVLPMDVGDIGIPAVLRYARSPATRMFLAGAQAVSCTGLFLSVVLLCFALLVLIGTPTVFEVGLIFVASSFAIPLAVMAVQRLLGFDDSSSGRSALAAAAESASFGPQFCVILALMDIREHSHAWTMHLFPVAAAAFVGVIVACAYNPPRREGLVVPPETSELALSALLDVIAVAALTLCFSLQSGWVVLTLALMLVVVIVVCASFTVPVVREASLELLDPIMPLRTDSSKARATLGPWRDRSRFGMRAMVLLSAVVAFWDVAVYASQHQPPPDYYPSDGYDYRQDGYRPDYPAAEGSGEWNGEHYGEHYGGDYDDRHYDGMHGDHYDDDHYDDDHYGDGHHDYHDNDHYGDYHDDDHYGDGSENHYGDGPHNFSDPLNSEDSDETQGAIGDADESLVGAVSASHSDIAHEGSAASGGAQDVDDKASASPDAQGSDVRIDAEGSTVSGMSQDAQASRVSASVDAQGSDGTVDVEGSKPSDGGQEAEASSAPALSSGGNGTIAAEETNNEAEKAAGNTSQAGN